MMSKLIRYMDRKLYPGIDGNWDNKIFRQCILERVSPDFVCLDYGAGRGNVEEMNFRNVVKQVMGVDPDDAVLENPYLDEARLIDLANNMIPYDDNTFDLVFSDNVLEHIQDPLIVMAEIFRVLKPGGLFLAKTPNKIHYMPLVAMLTPTWFHRLYNKRRGRDEVDTFPTMYRLNTKRAVEFFANKVGLELVDVRYLESRPEYLRLSPVTYLFGYLYERLVNKFECLARFRVVLIVELRKHPIAAC